MDEKNSLSGLISTFVRHPTAANLLMAIMILLGVFGLSRLNTQFFPTIEIPIIRVSIAWPGASAADVEENILDGLEPELRFLDGIDEVSSVARDGSASITMEFDADADMQKALSDVQQAVDQVTTLPDDAEQPVIRQIAFYERVAKMSISGPLPEATIKSYAKKVRDGLLAAGIDRVTMSRARDEEIWVTVHEAALRRIDFAQGDIITAIQSNIRDAPSGVLKGDVEMQLRLRGDRKSPEEIGQIEVKSSNTGEKIYLKDLAKIEAKFDRDGSIGFFKGNPMIELRVFRSLSSDTLKTMETFKSYVAKIAPTLPANLTVVTYDIRGKFVKQRLGILVSNGMQGLVLVLIVLFIFLNARVAFWVAMGIPIALLATMLVMWISGQTINMVSMFALIMMIGIIVDDAIVVGEHTAARQEMGDGRKDAAERGAIRMMNPVLAATLTTQAAFMPIFLIRDRIGDIMSAVPLVVTAVLIASIIECFFVLPGHLGHGFGKPKPPGRFRQKFDDGMRRYREGPHRRFAEFSFDWRYTTVALAIGLLILMLGFVAGGRIGFRFFPSPESENIRAAVVFSAGIPRRDQRKAMEAVERSLYLTESKILGKKPELAKGKGEADPDADEDGTRIVKLSFVGFGFAGRSSGDHLAQIDVQLMESEKRSIATSKFLRAWRKNLPKLAGVERISLAGRRSGPPGRDVDVRLENAPVDKLKAAAEEIKVVLSGYPGVGAVEDDLPFGKQEINLRLTPRGRALGFSSQNVGRQVRNAFEGAIAARFARGDEEITVRVLRENGLTGMAGFASFYLRSPSGEWVPVDEVVDITEKAGFSIIQRKDGVRTVAVTADLDLEIASTPETIERLEADIMPIVAEKYGLTYRFKGRAEERSRSFADLKLGGYLSLVVIYIILAWVLGSYFMPLAVMGIIPFGLVGAILGHVVMGMNLTLISLLGLLGLSGILVNDSIILVTQFIERMKNNNDVRAAAVGASQDRLRAVLLTSLTTIGGLLPLLFETSRQAQFLIPMAVTLVFGLLIATVLVLVLVPALLGIGHDITGALGKLKTRYRRKLDLPGETG